jgi:hypothetical protein
VSTRSCYGWVDASQGKGYHYDLRGIKIRLRGTFTLRSPISPPCVANGSARDAKKRDEKVTSLDLSSRYVGLEPDFCTRITLPNTSDCKHALAWNRRNLTAANRLTHQGDACNRGSRMNIGCPIISTPIARLGTKTVPSRIRNAIQRPQSGWFHLCLQSPILIKR